MSSTRRVQYSVRAVDGHTDGTDESFTIHTKENEPTAWWKVDLNVEVHSPMIRIFFRFDFPKPTLTTVTPGCAEGVWYGPDCRKLCTARHCKIKSSCDVTQGACDGGCNPGWREADCTQVCPAGAYGVDCNNACGRCGNTSLCHHETGSCPDGCEAGWHLDLCKEACPNGKYGLNCAAQCGHCNGSCDVVDGRCLQGCSHGYRGPRCLRVIGQSRNPRIQNRTLYIAGGKTTALSKENQKQKLPNTNKTTHSFTKITGLGVLVGGLVGVALTLILAVAVYLCLHCRPCRLYWNHRSVKEEETKDTQKSLTKDTGKSLTINKRIETCV
ncbi:multiple epidermal growth factor-like domains protein 10 [Haliotis rubra]|uniref:multiple epidermal growth factor-like domains protein 10 n=1 Tax=Haliotis rubra TaxID=36100 RepID=UPI001EE52C4D|nr:multiple epidermal growth factor-like domains protein 10 [Haliotis rubra]